MGECQSFIRRISLLRRLERSPDGIRVADTARDLRVDRRYIYRDLAALEKAGIPIYDDYVAGEKRKRLEEGYRRGRGINLTGSEILALRHARRALEALDGSGLHAAFQGLINKLDAHLPASVRRMARQMDTTLVGASFGRPRYTDLDDLLDPLYRAVDQSTSVEILYHDNRGSQTRRVVDPYHLFFLPRGMLYLLAWCHLRGEMRTFSLIRISYVSPTDQTFAPDPALDLEALVGQRFRVMADGNVTRVRIRFDKEVAAYVCERTWHESQEIITFSNGKVDLIIKVEGLDEVRSWILGFGYHAKVISPASLAIEVREELARTLKLYDRKKTKKKDPL